jgi:L-ascorbate metabolism protein UlaG (beta-lactamase superfamily)
MEATLEFIGTATTLLRLGPHTLLTDPDFRHRGHRAYLGKGLFSKRRTEPAAQPDDLPTVDAVLLSHLHGDHFDPIARDRLDHSLPVLTTPAASRKLGRWGFGAARGMATWERAALADGLSVTSVPGQHAPGPARPLLPPVMGSVIEVEHGGDGGRPFRVYITGDTLCRPWLAEIGERFGPLDAMVIHLGGTRAAGLLVTMDGDQGADLVEMLAPALTVPVHYDDYTVFRSPLSDFVDAARRRELPTTVRTVGRGETVPLTP